MDPIKPVALPCTGWQPACGLPLGDMRGFGRVRGDAALDRLALDRARGWLVASAPDAPLLSLQMQEDVRWVAAYVPGTNVLETTGRSAGAELRIVDFMPVAEGRPGQSEAVAAGEFVRIITCTEGEASFGIACAASVDGSAATQARTREGWYVSCSAPMEFDTGMAVATVRLAAGESAVVVIGQSPLQGGAALVAHAWHALGDTIHYWTWWSDRCRYKGDDFDAALRDALGLKLACTPEAGFLVEDPGTAGFTLAPVGERARAAARFLALGYRNECVSLLAHIVEQHASAPCERWPLDPAVAETLESYIEKYGTTGLPAALAAAREHINLAALQR